MDRKSFFKILPGLLAAPAIAKELAQLPAQPIVHQGTMGIYAMIREEYYKPRVYRMYVTKEMLDDWHQAIDDDWVMHQKALNEASEN